MNTVRYAYLREGPDLPVGEDSGFVEVAEPLADVLCVAALHDTH